MPTPRTDTFSNDWAFNFRNDILNMMIDSTANVQAIGGRDVYGNPCFCALFRGGVVCAGMPI